MDPVRLKLNLKADEKVSTLAVDTIGQDFDKGNLDASPHSVDMGNRNWYEVRLQGKVPERRGYHSTFIHQDYMYIYGGHDIREGSMDNMWVINLNRFSDLDKAPED